MRRLWALLFLNLIIREAWSDIYMQNPRGSNNRWNENGRNRNNANRLFDSQNNNRGGYNVGSLYYIVGSTLQIEWTNQHSCGDQNNHCDIILQYMCGDLVRDGTSTSTIPDNPAQCENLDCNADLQYGMHEDFYSYTHCKLRTRNTGLFTANQNVGPAATRTRQNPGGTRFGYECAEERDYYPYWGPTQWRDIAVITNDVTRCPMYVNESQNVKSKFACFISETYLYQNSQKNPNERIPISKERCEAFEYTENGALKRGVWMEYSSHGIAAPACVQSQASRDNHLGNGPGGEHLSYNWTIPDNVHENCALRMRYNITTTEYERDNTTSDFNNRLRNSGNGVDLWSKHGLTETEGVNRGYRLQNNPVLNVFDMNPSNNKLPLRLAVNTAQYGRTFQDRSHVFAIRARPSSIPTTSRIVNLNVRGKRGNIVQVYPAVEYDFVPNTALVSTRDATHIHFQWTGSDNNPNNNDGQGRAGTDRSNAVLMAEPVYTEGDPTTYKVDTYGQLGSSYPRHLSQGAMAGFDRATRTSLALLLPHLGGDMDELNDAGTYYDLGPRQITSSGTYNYMCTRNNNFSNRSQKGKIQATSSVFAERTVDHTGATITVTNSDDTVAEVEIPANSLRSQVFVSLSETETNDVDLETNPPNTEYISNIVELNPRNLVFVDGNEAILRFKLTDDVAALNVITIYRSNAEVSIWNKLEVAEHTDGMVTVKTNRGGYFVATKSLNVGAVAGLTIGLLAAVVLLVGLIVLFRKKRLSFGGKV